MGALKESVVLLLLFVQGELLSAAKPSGRLRSEKCLVLKEHSDPLVLAAGCSQAECVHRWRAQTTLKELAHIMMKADCAELGGNLAG